MKNEYTISEVFKCVSDAKFVFEANDGSHFLTLTLDTPNARIAELDKCFDEQRVVLLEIKVR